MPQEGAQHSNSIECHDSHPSEVRDKQHEPLTIPLIRVESSHNPANQEGRILLALSDIKDGRIKSIRAAAKLYDIPRSTLQTRAHGQISRADKRPSGHKLTQYEEDSLTKPSTVREIANILLTARGTTPPLTVGVNWASTFVNRRDKLQSRYSKRYDYQRALNEDPKVIREWFLTVQRVVDENGIQPEDIYNFDETGFAIGLISAQKVITRRDLYGRRPLLQPGNREWVTAIETTCADGYSLPPCIIFKGQVYIAGWFESLNFPPNSRIEVSNNGWTTDEIGLRWLQKLFIPLTNSRVRGRFRLLILDGHGSHLTPQFDRICAENDIIPLCMPSHSSHLLQPLDVGCFAVLKRAYGRFVSDLARTGYNHIDKLDFLADYPRARLEAFQPNIIQSSFAATGIVPVNADRVLSKLNISIRTPSPLSSRPSSRSSQFTPKTPKTAIQLEKQASMLKELLKQRSHSPPTPSKRMLDQIIKGHAKALHHTALLVKENADLRAANEKKRQKRTRSTRQIAHEEGLSFEEGLQLVQQQIEPMEADRVVSHEQVDLPQQPIQPARRAPPTCSGCGVTGHKINQCKNRLVQNELMRCC
ncbi:hypothetical protein PMG11_02335 [Penicillium brasilianum]|uniref:HTH CENPB-type domain-containing protein n=1 Tax=Penicillium brasilianum TaxID=104259 RepID=A0A0F7TJN3_PENBI|nr:hypothetical protein PMG11_02335 [Penicillium brasilianum]